MPILITTMLTAAHARRKIYNKEFAMNSHDFDIIRCPSCNVKNRVPRSKTGLRPKCGRCGTPLLPAKPVEVTDATFKQEVLDSPVPVLLDCWAPWCGPCRMVAPVMDQISAEFSGRLKVAKLNTDQNPATAQQFGIRSIPTLLLFKDGQLVDTMVGAMPKAQIEARLRQVV